MRNQRFGILVLAGLLSGMTAAAPAKNAAFERFKGLAGDWVAAEDGEMAKKGDLVAQYRLTGSGSAVVEDIFPGTPHAMTTVYHLDGPDLVLTHYCMEGNQPRMRAKATSSPKVVFAYDGGTNINAKTDRHMHDATFEFVGKDELKSEWHELEQGKPVMTATMHLVRKSS
jgi:hypothetical protein